VRYARSPSQRRPPTIFVSLPRSKRRSEEVATLVAREPTPSEVGHLELAYDYFGEAALMDLRDLEHNTRDGVHIASLAGAWIAAVAGLGGMRDHGGALSFKPRLPARLERLAFGLHFQGRRLRVEVARSEAVYVLLAGPPLKIRHHDETIRISTDEPTRRPIPPARAVPRPTQPRGRAPLLRLDETARLAA
jgi:alpha,alpha-trehalose phosphorylase